MREKPIESLFIIDKNDITKELIIEKFLENSYQIIYIVENNVLVGIISLGQYVKNYNNSKNWISKNFTSVLIDDYKKVEIIKKIFQNKKINQVPIINKNREILFECERKNYIETEETEIQEEKVIFIKKYLDALHIPYKIFVKEKIKLADIGEDTTKKRILFADKRIAKLASTMNKHAYFLGDMFVKALNFNKMVNILFELNQKEIGCYFFLRPDICPQGNYSEDAKRRMELGLSFSFMFNNFSEYQHEFKILLEERYSKEYVEQLAAIPPIIKKCETFCHVDWESPCVNVRNGFRLTNNNNKGAVTNIYIYGRCGAFGYAVEDGETIASYLQNKMQQNQKKINVYNRGLWGAGINEILTNIQNQIAGMEKDIVVFYMYDFEKEEIAYFQNIGLHLFDCTEVLYHNIPARNKFYDFPGHMMAEGYAVIAEYIFEILEKTEYKKKESTLDIKENVITHFSETKEYNEREWISKLNEYLLQIKEAYPYPPKTDTVGAIVMNCNPFTLGHRYLIEKALKEVDCLYVFVLQENKSYFEFADRISLVKQGTKDLKNIFVVPSGAFIISTLTFPEYFMKNQLQNVKIDTTRDLEIFGKYIAPSLNITIRFAGEEPIDMLTKQYNDNMRIVLPKYAIEFKEIKRVENGQGVISASKVRRLLEKGEFEKLQEFVPQTTYKYLIEKFNKM